MQNENSINTAALNIQEQPKRAMNGNYVSKIYERFTAIQKMYLVILSIQIFLSIIYYELDFIGQYSKSNAILYCLNFSTIPSIFMGILSYKSYNKLKNSQMKQLDALTIDKLCFDCLLILIQPVWFLQNVYIDNYNLKNFYSTQFKLNYLLVLCSLFRLSLLIPSFLNLLSFKNPRASRVCKIYNLQNSNLYTIKCCFKQSPIALMGVAFIQSFAIFSFAYRVSERTLHENGFHEFFTNSMWLVVVTMSSVGFGDIYPQTTIGRIVGMVCIICGALTVSIIVVVLLNTFELDQNENKSLKILKKLQDKKEIKQIAANYLRISLWRVWKNYQQRKKDRYCQIQQETDKQKSLRKLLRQKIRVSKFSSTNSMDIGEQMSSNFEKVQYNIQNLQQNSEQLIKFLGKRYFINLQEIKQQTRTIQGSGFYHGSH